MAIAAYVLKKPFEVSFTGNPMPYAFAITPYGNIERKQDIRLVVRILIENNFGSNIFNEVKSQAFYPDESGRVNFDVKKIIQPYLDYLMPNPLLLKPVEALQQRKRYRVDYFLMQNNSIVGSIEEGVKLYAIKGGMSFDEWHPKDFFIKGILEEKKSLQFEPLRKIAFDELRYFYWLYPYDDAKLQTVMIDIELDDNTTIQHNLEQKITVGKWGVCCVPAGFNQLKLNELVTDGTTAISYTIQVKTDVNSIVSPIQFILEQRNFYNTYQLLYRNSTGGLETLYLRGQVDFETEYARQQIQSTVPPSYFTNLVLNAQQNDINATETPKFKGDTGFLNRVSSDRLRDFFISNQKFEIVGDIKNEEKVKLVPVTILTKSTKFFSNQDNLISTNIEWQRAYVNEFYTPNKLVSTIKACPALESFVVTQINKNLLQIMYALEVPYDKVEIQIITSMGTEIIILNGNAQTVRQPFINPVLNTTNTETIEVKARCICDENSNPVDYGPFSTVELDILGNTLPIANDDNFSIPYGFNTAQTLMGSVLSNDYDPDGDQIECIVVNNAATNEGGTYSITALGIVSYTPPSSIFVGQDYFDYEIQEVGGNTTVTARVYINVGSVTGNIYAKLVLRNVQTITGQYTSITTGEVWIDFFSNPSNNQQIDMTGLGLTINHNQHIFEQDFNGNQTNTDNPVSVLAEGTKMMIFEGTLYNELSDPNYQFSRILENIYSVLPGTGYIVI